MNITTKVVAYMEVLKRADIEAMPPAQRRRFADLCEHWRRVAEQGTDQRQAGVLSDLRRGQRGE